MTNLDNAEYTFDTCVFIDLFESYPDDVFVSIWELIEKQFLENKIIIIKDVVDELSKVHDKIYEYVIEKKSNIIELTEETQINLTDIINRFPDWIKPYNGRNAADPCLVALGRTYDIKVITQEKIKGNKLKIPYICNILEVECGNFIDYLRDNNVRL